MRRVLMLAFAAALTWSVAGCGEKPMVTVYKQGQYQGKPDMQPWDGDPFKGDKNAWEKTVKARNLGQNEYVRISGGS
ncbi:MAG: hypothetical protein HYV99_08325 [Betaproteobacteria bacterium]|nr:hypothetical protein [Betaproteobacteria bacterium]MBI2509952.1 hypothetical protein [Betaproteobacteria bacterium]